MQDCPFCWPCYGLRPEPVNKNIEGVACCYTCWYVVRAVPSAAQWMLEVYKKSQIVEVK